MLISEILVMIARGALLSSLVLAVIAIAIVCICLVIEYRDEQEEVRRIFEREQEIED